MELVFSRRAWEDLRYWIGADPRAALRIARLIEGVLREPFSGIGSPEPLKHQLAGCWSRRITLEHRLVYRICGEKCEVLQCRYHY